MGKSRVLTLIEKVDIIREFMRTKQTSGLARMFNCHRGQVHHILKHKDEYLSDWLTTKDPSRTRRPKCKVLNALGLILNEWVLRCSQYDFTLTDEAIKSTAIEISKALKYRLFKPNPKWYQRFKQKYKLDKVADWSEWRSPRAGAKQLSLDLEDIINDLRAVHGEAVIPYYVQLNDDSFKDLTVRCYGDQNVAEELGELICGTDANAPIDLDMIADPADDFAGSTNSYNGYVSYHESESEDNYPTINIDNDDDSNDEDAVHQASALSAVKIPHRDVKDFEAKAIRSYREALNVLGPLEQFALVKEDVRAVGLINQLEIIFQQQMQNENSLMAD